MSENLEDYDASDKEQVNTARKKAARLEAERLRFIASAMDFPEGRAWLYNLLSFCRIFDNVFMEEETHKTSFLLGHQNCGKFILADVMEACPDKYVVMLKEANEEKLKNG